MAGKPKGESQTSPSKQKAPVGLTGGSGFRFENAVAARFLVDMLTGKNSLGTDFGRVVRVDWQARDAGWLADDFAITCRTAAGDERAAGISVRSYQQLGRTGFNADFVNIAWRQWLNQATSRQFRRGVDAMVLATGDLANDVRKAWSDLSKQAKAAGSAPERIAARLAEDQGQGVQSSALQRAIFESLSRPKDLNGEQGSNIDDRVALIRDLSVLHFDYDAEPSSGQTQSILECQNALASGDPAEAVNLWDRLVGIADKSRPAGGSLDLPGLLAMLRRQFALKDHPDFRADWERLRRHTADAMADINGQIADANAAHLTRDKDLAKIAASLDANRACILVGESGSGKSALAKQLSTNRYPRSVWLSAVDLDHKKPAEFERALGLRYRLAETLLASPERCLVVVDAAEIYPSDALGLAVQLVKDLLVSPDVQHVHVLITVQFEAADRVIRQLSQLGVPDAALNTETLARPSDDELAALLAALPQLNWISLRPEIRPLLTNLKVLDLTARTLRSEKALGDRPSLGLTTLIDILWEDWVERGDQKYGRSHVLKTVAMEEADKFSSGVTLQSLGYAEALPGLETAGLVRVKNERVGFTHDLLGDWARMRVLVGDDPATSATIRERVQSPRWHKAIRLFGQRVLEQAMDVPSAWRTSVESASDESAAAALLRDLFLESLFLATNAAALLTRTWPVLIANEGMLLRRLLDRFLFIATLPDTQLLALASGEDDAERFDYAFRIPQLPYWAPMLTVLHAHRDDVARNAPYQAARVCALWLRTMPFEIGPDVRMPWRQEAAGLAFAIAREVQARTEENSYYGLREDKVIYEALLYAARDLPTDVAELSLELAKRRPLSPATNARVQATREKLRQERKETEKTKRKAMMSPIIPRSGRLTPQAPDGPASRVGHGFQEACLETPAAFATLVQADPNAALEVLLAVCIEEPHEDTYGSSSLEDYGLAYWHAADPPAYFRGPFLSFLRLAPEQGFTCVLRLVNFATQRAFGDKIGVTVEIDGQPKLWRGDSNVFRWHHDWPSFHGAMIQSALMALEQWFYEQIDQGHDVAEAARRIVAESESLAFAGVLCDVGKKEPSLFAGALKPLFSAWLLWHWDLQISNLRLAGQSSMLGSWIMQPQQLITLIREWHALPHRKELLLFTNGAIPRMMLSKAEFRPFFEGVRKRWKVELDSEGNPEALRLLIERITPENYTFPTAGSESQEINFQWPEAIARQHEKELPRITRRNAVTSVPFNCRKVLDAGAPLPSDQLAPLLNWLQELDTKPPQLEADTGEALFPIENAILGGVAVLVAFHLDWLREDASRIDWCRAKLKAVVEHPPEPSGFDSEVALGSFRWDDFAAETGVRLLAADRSDPLARRLVALAITGFHYDTIGLAMRRAFHLRGKLGDDFDRLTTLSVQWAALRVLGTRGPEASEADKEDWAAKKAALVAGFVDRTLTIDLPDLKRINAETVVAYEERRRRTWPDYEPTARRKSQKGAFGGSREELYPELLGFDERVLAGALAYLDPHAAQTPEERARWLILMRALLQLTLDRLPKADDPEHQEIKGLPSGFDDWVFGIVARAIPRLTSTENPDGLWRSILDLGATAHDWVERFFWYWFTEGLRSAGSPAEFVRIWRSMILYATSNPNWNRSTYGSYRVDGMVIELLGLDARWNAHAIDEAYVPALGAMADLFAKVAELWFPMPRVVRNFLHFVVQPAAAELLLPALPWLAKAVASYSTYDWRDGIEDGLVEYLRVCAQRSRDTVIADPALRKAYFYLLAIVVSRGSHAAIALRDRLAS